MTQSCNEAYEYYYVLYEKSTIAELKIFYSWPCSQEPATAPYTLTPRSFKIHFILLSHRPQGLTNGLFTFNISYLNDKTYTTASVAMSART
jgi:hypothetical protein